LANIVWKTHGIPRRGSGDLETKIMAIYLRSHVEIALPPYVTQLPITLSQF